MSNLLSICIPTYNRAEYLRACLSSLLQSAKGYESYLEIVISDNASNDNTAEVVHTFQKFSPFIKYYRNNVNIGADKNIYNVAKLATNKYLWIFGDDDIVEKNSLQLFFRDIENNYDLIISNYSIWSKDFKHLKEEQVLPIKTKETVFTCPDNVMKLFGAHLGYISCFIIKKECFFKLPGDTYQTFTEYGFPQICALYYGIFPNSKVKYIHNSLIRNRSNNSEYYDWYKYHVIGTSLVFNKLLEYGYSKDSINSAKKMIIQKVILHLLISARDSKSRSGTFRVLLKYYKSFFIFWFFCIPCIFIPCSFARFVFNNLKKGNLIQSLKRTIYFF